MAGKLRDFAWGIGTARLLSDPRVLDAIVTAIDN